MNNTTKKKVISLGECLVELAPEEASLYTMSYAGDSYNMAVYLKRQFGDILDVSYMTGLGTDPVSEKMIAAFKSEDIGVELVKRTPDRLPGLYTIENDEHGERFFHYWRSESAARTMLADISLENLVATFSEADLVFLSGITLAVLDDRQLNLLMEALDHLPEETLVAFDPNYRPKLWNSIEECRDCFQRMGEVSDWILTTINDETSVWEDHDIDAIISRWRALGCSEVVIKLGNEGCLVTIGNTFEKVPLREKLASVDTTGAGDSFCAGYIGSRLSGESPVQAGSRGHAIAAKVVMHRGAIIPKEQWKPAF